MTQRVKKLTVLPGLLLLINCNVCIAEPPSKAEYNNDFLKQNKSRSVNEDSILEVGPGKKYRYPSIAAKYAKDGDMVFIDASVDYLNDWVTWKQNDLTIKGVKGRPKISSSKMIDNGKAIWVIKGNNIRIENIEFAGARVRHNNGAALRIEGANLIVKNCYIHNNQNGILSGKNLSSTITILTSEFSHNGYGRGQTHNVYIGEVKKLRFVGNFSHHAKIGHNLKSRAIRNEILYNRFMDGHEGKSSYLIDLPNGGYSVVMGNVLQQGPKTDNWALLSYGAEGINANRQNFLYVTFNTFVNNRSSGLFIQAKVAVNGLIANNIFSGKGRLLKGDLPHSNNIIKEKYKNFFDESIFDYHTKDSSKELENSEIILTSEGKSLIPEYQIELQGLQKRTKSGSTYDIGAYESWLY